MTERTTPEQRIESAKARAVADAKRRGLDEPHQHEAAREAAELAADPALNRFIDDMENRQVVAEEKERRELIQRQNRAERELAEELERVRRDRLGFCRAKRPGLSEEEFDRSVWPSLKAAFLAGEEDAVDRERREKAAPVF
jgi:hypothetical protein